MRRRLALEPLQNFGNVLGYMSPLREPSTTCEGGSYPSVCRGAKTWRERDRERRRETERERQKEKKRGETHRERQREKERHRAREREMLAGRKARQK